MNFSQFIKVETRWVSTILITCCFIYCSFINNLDKNVFLKYPNMYSNWVPHLSTQCFQVTPLAASERYCSVNIKIYQISKCYLPTNIIPRWPRDVKTYISHWGTNGKAYNKYFQRRIQTPTTKYLQHSGNFDLQMREVR